MRTFVIFAACGACGPIPGTQPATPPPQPQQQQFESSPSGPPGAAPTAVTEPIATPMGTGATTVAQHFVDAHNAVRAKHCAPPLTWNPKIAAVAQKWADSLRDQGCKFGHSGNQEYGENLAAGTAGALDPEATVKMWYDEISLYKFPDGGFSMQTGHFTQVVWKGTTEVGCGHSTCNGNDIWVCNYAPFGNVEGEYRANVLPTSCKK
ncbi:MAG TPA: CAP domain-containing protein [Kofleriaceae bacterium]